ncbi:MAG: hypothetical protein MR896_10455, partial [Clostridiales bacterium]|nr:hypothetical protein [Clostridiales bacterium]
RMYLLRVKITRFVLSIRFFLSYNLHDGAAADTNRNENKRRRIVCFLIECEWEQTYSAAAYKPICAVSIGAYAV